MYNLECKMCGARNGIEEDMNYFNCDACGTTNTVPKITEENRVRLFNRANYFRQKGEFDKSIKAFEGVIEEGGEDPEAKWGMVLAKYGIEYVQDPHTGKRIPTCHRVHTESILTDDDYIATLDYAKDDYIRSLYEKEANKIHEIQQGILSVAKWEEPFDVFICYKESTEGGSRTVDSTLAEEIYEKLTKEGFKVFFSRITLEEKIGMQYEPYIFAALHSAKVMLLVATEVEYINAVWVKNEWSRFITLKQKDREKLIIPCYKKMDIYDMPEQLTIYQAQDMSKIGFMQDLVRGIKKICEKKSELNKQSIYRKENEDPNAMLDRAFIALGDGYFGKAEKLLDAVLNIDSRCAQAYLGLLMIERMCCHEDDLKQSTRPLEDSLSYKHILEFDKGALKEKVKSYNQFIIDENEKKAKEYLDSEILYCESKLKSIPKVIIEHQKNIEKYELEKEEVARKLNDLTVTADYLKYEVEKIAIIGQDGQTKLKQRYLFVICIISTLIVIPMGYEVGMVGSGLGYMVLFSVFIVVMGRIMQNRYASYHLVVMDIEETNNETRNIQRDLEENINNLKKIVEEKSLLEKDYREKKESYDTDVKRMKMEDRTKIGKVL